MKEEKNFSEIHPIPVLKDNIIWVWIQGKQAVVIDPALCDPVIKFLEKNNLRLIAILQTHHHSDHIGGTEEILRQWPEANVIASKKDKSRIPFQTKSVIDKERFTLMGSEVKVLEVHGHTNAHVAYFITKDINNKRPILFCGDTLFGGGCGRVFDGTIDQMYNSIKKINSLPEDTYIYCAHEYTENNLIWASSIHPENPNIKDRLEEVSKKRLMGISSLPSTLKEERNTNLFIRARNIEDFKKLRLSKDNWN